MVKVSKIEFSDINNNCYNEKFTEYHLKRIEEEICSEKNYNSIQDVLDCKSEETGFKLFDLDNDNFRKIISPKPWLVTLSKITLSHLDSLFGYTGFLTGFQGFIINEYVDSKFTSRISEAEGNTVINCDSEPCLGNITFSANYDNDSTELSLIFQVGFFFMVVSFCINVTVCLLTYLLGMQIRGGFYKKSYMILTEACQYLSVFGSSTFTLSLLILLYTIQISDYLLYTIYGLVILCNLTVNSVVISENCSNKKIWKTHRGRNLAYYIAENIHS